MSESRPGPAAPAIALDSGFRAMTGHDLGPDEAARLLAYLDLLARWNRAYNLTAVTEPVQMVTRHLLDSLAVLPWAGNGRLLDAGSGAGLPGVPLAIMRPGLAVTLLDSGGKKVRFLNHVRRELPLANVEVVQCRLEAYRPQERPDRVISRAFASLAEFAGAARPLLAEHSRLLAMKGRLPRSELAALPSWVRVDRVVQLEVPGLQEQRHLVIMSVRR